jgi:hypothetical protein
MVCVGAQAQTFSRAPSAEEQCLTPGPAERGAPVYPEKMLAQREDRTVRVELSFDGPEQAPRLKRLAHTDNDEFFDAVKDYVQRFRVPCMQAGAPAARVEMEFRFTLSNGRRVFTRTTATQEEIERRKALFSCTTRSNPQARDYPRAALERGLQGLVVLDMNFTDAGSPPSVKVLHDGGSAQFAKMAQALVEEFRMPCLPPGEQLSSRFEYVFKIQDGDKAWLNDMALPNFLAMVKGIAEKKAYFDFTTMGCPFVVNFALRQPYLPNKVGQLGDFQMSREPFIDWLSQLDLNVPIKQRELVMLHESTITVPCIKLDL